jgi:hypothetical protein
MRQIGVYSLPPSVFSFLTVVVVLHELTCCLTKDIFGAKIIMPSGVDPSDGAYGESGWKLEDELFGFKLALEARKDERGDLHKALSLVASVESQAGRSQTVCLCESSLSLCPLELCLRKPAQQPMKRG